MIIIKEYDLSVTVVPNTWKVWVKDKNDSMECCAIFKYKCDAETYIEEYTYGGHEQAIMTGHKTVIAEYEEDEDGPIVAEEYTNLLNSPPRPDTDAHKPELL